MRREGGVAAIEFAFVSIPFFGLVIGCIQTALIFTMNQALQTATMRVSREVMTNQAATLGLTSTSKMTDEIYKNLPAGFDKTKLYVDVESWPDWAQYNPNTIAYDNTGKATNLAFAPGSSGSIVLVRVMYDWPVFGGVFSAVLGGAAGFGLSNQPDDGYLMVATTVMRTE